MSDASEVKRWWVSIQDQDGRIVRRDVERLCLAGPEPEPEGYEVFIEVMPVEDHDRILLGHDAEIASLKAQLSMTNSNWPHEKKLHETIAEQKRLLKALEIALRSLRDDIPLVSQRRIIDDALAELEEARGAK